MDNENKKIKRPCTVPCACPEHHRDSAQVLYMMPNFQPTASEQEIFLDCISDPDFPQEGSCSSMPFDDPLAIREALERAANATQMLLKNFDKAGGNWAGGRPCSATLEITARLLRDTDSKDPQICLQGKPVTVKMPLEFDPNNGQLSVGQSAQPRSILPVKVEQPPKRTTGPDCPALIFMQDERPPKPSCFHSRTQDMQTDKSYMRDRWMPHKANDQQREAAPSQTDASYLKGQRKIQEMEQGDRTSDESLNTKRSQTENSFLHDRYLRLRNKEMSEDKHSQTALKQDLCQMGNIRYPTQFCICPSSPDEEMPSTSNYTYSVCKSKSQPSLSGHDSGQASAQPSGPIDPCPKAQSQPSIPSCDCMPTTSDLMNSCGKDPTKAPRAMLPVARSKNSGRLSYADDQSQRPCGLLAPNDAKTPHPSLTSRRSKQSYSQGYTIQLDELDESIDSRSLLGKVTCLCQQSNQSKLASCATSYKTVRSSAGKVTGSSAEDADNREDGERGKSRPTTCGSVKSTQLQCSKATCICPSKSKFSPQRPRDNDVFRDCESSSTTSIGCVSQVDEKSFQSRASKLNRECKCLPVISITLPSGQLICRPPTRKDRIVDMLNQLANAADCDCNPQRCAMIHQLFKEINKMLRLDDDESQSQSQSDPAPMTFDECIAAGGPRPKKLAPPPSKKQSRQQECLEQMKKFLEHCYGSTKPMEETEIYNIEFDPDFDKEAEGNERDDGFKEESKGSSAEGGEGGEGVSAAAEGDEEEEDIFFGDCLNVSSEEIQSTMCDECNDDAAFQGKPADNADECNEECESQEMCPLECEVQEIEAECAVTVDTEMAKDELLQIIAEAVDTDIAVDLNDVECQEALLDETADGAECGVCETDGGGGGGDDECTCQLEECNGAPVEDGPPSGPCICCHCRALICDNECKSVAKTLDAVECDPVCEMKYFIDSIIIDLDSMDHVLRQKEIKPKAPQATRMLGRCPRDSFPVTITDVSGLGCAALYVRWQVHDCCGIAGYEIYVDGHLTNRLYSFRHEASVAANIDVTKPHQIVLRAHPIGQDFAGDSCNCSTVANPHPELAAGAQKPWSPSVFFYDPC